MDTSQALLDYYDAHLARHGDTAQGAAWPDEAGRRARFRMGLDLVLEHARHGPVTLCDLGCGTGELLRFLRDAGLDRRITYVGIDRSSLAIGIARDKFPEATFHCLDMLAADAAALERVLDCDFVFANGLFTVKHEASHARMWEFMTAMLRTVWPRVRRGVVFNVMSTVVDWERDDLFHVSFDELARFLRGLAGRAIGFRADRDLYEYMAYALKDAPDDAEATRPQASTGASTSVPVCRPRLPRAEAVAPYLAHLDQARRYTNHGSLLERFTEGFARTLGIGDDALCLASSGTSALTGAILATAGRATADRPLALCPAYTFAATALAAQACGFEPMLVDVDPDDWVLTPQIAARQLDRVGLVLATAAYGQAAPQQAWAAFSHDAGIPVVIDAAASFEQALAHPEETLGRVPVVLSLHATKAFGIGEGGAVLCADRDVIERVYGALNFGFLGGVRECRMPGINGKLSEYHCAVGLAQLAQWPMLQAQFARVAAGYRSQALDHGLADRIATAPRLGSCYALFVAHDAREAASVACALENAQIDYRRWYGRGLHLETHFAAGAHGPLPQTERLAPCLLGLPVAPDLTDEEIARVVAALASGVWQAARDAGRAKGLAGVAP